MNKSNKPLTIGISSQSRVFPEIQKSITDAGYEGNWKNNKCVDLRDTNIRLILVKGIEEIAYRVESQLLDGLFIGSDIVEEVNLLMQEEAKKRTKNPEDLLLKSMLNTGLCRARLAMMAPEGMHITTQEGELTVLSKYSLLAAQELSKREQDLQHMSLKFTVREIESRADELAGQTRQMAYDIVDSGKTMRCSGLVEVSGMVEEIRSSVFFTLPKAIPVSLQLFSTSVFQQENAMTDFSAEIDRAINPNKTYFGSPDRTAFTNDIRPMWGRSDQEMWDRKNMDR